MGTEEKQVGMKTRKRGQMTSVKKEFVDLAVLHSVFIVTNEGLQLSYWFDREFCFVFVVVAVEG